MSKQESIIITPYLEPDEEILWLNRGEKLRLSSFGSNDVLPYVIRGFPVILLLIFMLLEQIDLSLILLLLVPLLFLEIFFWRSRKNENYHFQEIEKQHQLLNGLLIAISNFHVFVQFEHDLHQYTWDELNIL